MLRNNTSICTLLKIFIMKEYWILSNAFSASLARILWFLSSFVDVVCGFERLELSQGGMCVCMYVLVCVYWAHKALVVACSLGYCREITTNKSIPWLSICVYTLYKYSRSKWFALWVGMQGSGRKLGENGKTLFFPKFLDCSGPMIPSYVLCFMSTCVYFVPRTKMEAFVALAATIYRQSTGRFGMNVFTLCFRMIVPGPESGNRRA